MAEDPHQLALRLMYLEKLEGYLAKPSQSSNPRMQLLRQRLSAARDCLLPSAPCGQDLHTLEKLLKDFFQKLEQAEAEALRAKHPQSSLPQASLPPPREPAPLAPPRVLKNRLVRPRALVGSQLHEQDVRDARQVVLPSHQ